MNGTHHTVQHMGTKLPSGQCNRPVTSVACQDSQRAGKTAPGVPCFPGWLTCHVTICDNYPPDGPVIERVTANL